MHKIEFYKDLAGEWRWRFVHSNGNILGCSGEGYKNRSDCIDGIESIAVAFLANNAMEVVVDGVVHETTLGNEIPLSARIVA
tara:strand:+ start:107 stop:352 length:246 start_codon:yes stop_codon:yes gene_type:complete